MSKEENIVALHIISSSIQMSRRFRDQKVVRRVHLPTLVLKHLQTLPPHCLWNLLLQSLT